MNNESGDACIDPSKLAMAIFGAIFGTLLLCTGFALAIWYLVRNHQIANKMFILDSGKRKRKDEEEQIEPPAVNIDEVDDGFHFGKEKMDLAHLSLAMELDEIPLEKSIEHLEKEEQIEEINEMKEELNQEENNEMVEKKMELATKIQPTANSANEKGIKESGSEQIKKSIVRHGVILDPLAIEKPSKIPRTADEERRFTKNGSTLAQHKRGPSEEAPSPEMAERLRALLSAEQFGMLETNRRRLEQERRQLRELGVI